MIRLFLVYRVNLDKPERIRAEGNSKEYVTAVLFDIIENIEVSAGEKPVKWQIRNTTESYKNVVDYTLME